MQVALPAASDTNPPRRHVRVPTKFAFAETPVDRAILLAGGRVEDLAGVLGVSPATVWNMRARSRGCGDLPAHHKRAMALWAAAQGWTLPEGFLTERRVFSDPREG